jgi:hypothetical protein
MGYTFSDDVVWLGNQPDFTRAVPNSKIWNMTIIRSANIMLDRLENKMQNILSEEALAHWRGIGRFFRGLRYAQLVLEYGDVPYYDHVVSDTDLDDLYKPRTPRDEVMDAIYDDFEYALENVRLNDGDQNVNRYVVAGFISRIALYEGCWQRYYYQNDERAKKFFEFAIEAGDMIINSGKYDIVTDFRSLFTSDNLSGNKDCILYRHYDPAVGVTHCIASNNNLAESLNFGPSTSLIKAFICNDGNVWQNSTIPDTEKFDISNLIKTRDSRFEASFYHKPHSRSRGSYFYINKFLPREVAEMVEAGSTPPFEFTSTNNKTDYPVLRYAEVLLNWIEAKAELEAMGGNSVTQNEIDISINKIRNRPLASKAIEKGVQKTEHLKLDNLPYDPKRDQRVSPLLWEIRRERRMEFAFEHSRYEDLRRWHKLDYMDTETNIDLLSGGWVNFPVELSSELNDANKGKISVVTLNGETIVYDGTNKSLMNGFFKHTTTIGRQPFLNQVNLNPYLAPVGKIQIDDYAKKGYVLQQTEGWPQN